jgi:hypothetical protein
MKPAIWRIFRNGRWSYSDSPSTRSEDRAAWQPLYAEQPTVQAEREACAKVAAWILKMPENDVSAAIRARGQA